MAGFAGSLKGAELMEAGSTLAASCERISRFIAGETPAA